MSDRSVTRERIRRYQIQQRVDGNWLPYGTGKLYDKHRGAERVLEKLGYQPDMRVAIVKIDEVRTFHFDKRKEAP